MEPETYDALSKGVVDGAMSPLKAMKGWKLGEVTKYHTLSPGLPTSGVRGYEQAKWNSLPPDVQKINRADQ